jgi:hypothetical protein
MHFGRSVEPVLFDRQLLKTINLDSLDTNGIWFRGNGLRRTLVPKETPFVNSSLSSANPQCGKLVYEMNFTISAK